MHALKQNNDRHFTILPILKSACHFILIWIRIGSEFGSSDAAKNLDYQVNILLKIGIGVRRIKNWSVEDWKKVVWVR